MPSNPGVVRFARDYLDAALRHHGDGHRETARQLILALLPGGRCTSEQVARHLGIDRRTLHRYLGEEGLTFSMLLNQVRIDLAVQHLRDSDLPAQEVGQLLGFSTPSAFSHWFRARFGLSIRRWSVSAQKSH